MDIGPMMEEASGESVAERLARLERRLDAREDVANRILRAEVARAVQSMGIVIDYLAERGVIDKAEMKTYIDERFLVMGAPSGEEPRRLAIDVYGWLLWSEMTEASRMRARRATSAFYNRPAVSRPRGSGSQGSLEREVGGYGDLVVEPVEE